MLARELIGVIDPSYARTRERIEVNAHEVGYIENGGKHIWDGFDDVLGREVESFSYHDEAFRIWTVRPSI